jgi:hypothetical protein
MPANTFNSTGIVDGQIVEASQVSQSVDAFTGAQDYDITLSGSLTISGSINLTGSLVNEFTGQFSSLGIGTSAPTAPTMLHIKDTAAGGDPIALIEAATGGDEARIRFQNTDISYDLGAYGSSGDGFQIVQDAAGTPKIPFVIDKDTIDYTLYASDNSVGVGLGASSTAILGVLPAGSFMALATVSGSTISGQVISASAAGENIHGTASYASYIENAISASYVKSTDIDFNYSISQQVNSGGEISATTGSFQKGKIQKDGGIEFSNDNSVGTYTLGITGSVEVDQGRLWIGDIIGNGVWMELNQLDDYLKIKGKIYTDDDLYVDNAVYISGSDPEQTMLRIGPEGALGANLPSMSLYPNAIEMCEDSVAYIGNFSNTSTAALWLSTGDATSASAVPAVEISASNSYGSTTYRDIKIPSGSLWLNQQEIPSSGGGTGPFPTYWTIGSEVNQKVCTDQGLKQLYRLHQKQSSTTTTMNMWQGDVSTWWGSQALFMHFKVQIIGSPTSGDKDGVWLEKEFTYYQTVASPYFAYTAAGTTVRMGASAYNTSDIITAISGDELQFQISTGTSNNTKWIGWMEVSMIGG